MNPMFMEGQQQGRLRLTRWQRIGRGLRSLTGLFTVDLAFWRGRERLKIEDATPLQQALRALFYRLLFLPLLLILMVILLVYLGTHPVRAVPTRDPLSLGIYYDPVSFSSTDGALLEAWLVPLYDAGMILEHKEQVMRGRQPAIILVHDHAAARDQMLPLVKPLHEAGYVVLVTSLRGTARTPMGSTFGLKEADDVRAAVDLLRRRPGIDPQRIAILGLGTGGNAAILAAERTPGIAALVLDRPATQVEKLMSEHLSPPQAWMSWVQPFTRWTFEFSYHVNVQNLDIASRETMKRVPILLFDSELSGTSPFRQHGMEQTVDFLNEHVGNIFNEREARVE